MFDITQYSEVFSNLRKLSPFVNEVYKYTSNPLILPVKVKLVELFFNKLKKVIDKKSFKKKLEKDMNFQSMFTGYMMEVDSSPDETSRLSNLRKLINSYIKSEEGSKIEAYEIFQVARKLKSFEFVVLSTAYKIFKNGRADHLQNKDADSWRQVVSEQINDTPSTRALIFSTENVLVKHQLIFPVRQGYNEYHHGTFRLTDLGRKMCELLEKY